MARRCALTLSGGGFPSTGAARAEWALQGDSLALTPEGGIPVILPLGSVGTLTGDGYSLSMTAGTGTIRLEKLGAEGPTLLDSLWRTWPSARAKALRIGGEGIPQVFQGRFAAPGAEPVPARLLLFEDVLAAALDGGGMAPVFLAHLASSAFDEASFQLVLTDWAGRSWSISHLAGATGAFAAAVDARRSALVAEGLDLLARSLPSLDGGSLSVLAGRWPPGRWLSLADLEAVVPGFSGKPLGGWLGGLARRREAAALMADARPEDTFLGMARASAYGTGEADEEAQDLSAAHDGDAAETPPEAAGEISPSPLWLLLRRGDRWMLEALAESGRATYVFGASEGLLDDLQCLLAAPRFSREALYLPVEKLTGDRAELAVAARELPFLIRLRAAFSGRAIHRGIDGWKSSLGL